MEKGKLNATVAENVYNAMKEKLIEFVDEVTNQMNKGNVHVLVPGGRAASWNTGTEAVDKMWDVIVTRLRDDVAEHMITYWIADCWPRLFVVDGAPLYAKLKHHPNDPYHFINDESNEAATAVADWMVAVSRLAVYSLAQPKGGNYLYNELAKKENRKHDWAKAKERATAPVRTNNE